MLPHIPAIEEALDEDASRGPSAPLAEAEAAWIAFEHNAPEASVAREGSASLLPRGQGSGVANGAAHLAGAFTGDGDDDAGLAELLARAAANVEMAHECCNPHDTIRKVAAEGRRRGSASEARRRRRRRPLKAGLARGLFPNTHREFEPGSQLDKFIHEDALAAFGGLLRFPVCLRELLLLLPKPLLLGGSSLIPSSAAGFSPHS